MKNLNNIRIVENLTEEEMELIHRELSAVHSYLCSKDQDNLTDKEQFEIVKLKQNMEILVLQKFIRKVKDLDSRISKIEDMLNHSKELISLKKDLDEALVKLGKEVLQKVEEHDEKDKEDK